MPGYSKALRERRFPQDVAIEAYVLPASVCLEFRYTMCISQAAGFFRVWKYRNVWSRRLMYSFLFVYCLLSVNIGGCWLGKR